MKRGCLFELILALLIISLACTLYLVMVATPEKVTGWTVKGDWSPDYMFVGSNDTLYEFKTNEIATSVRGLETKTKGDEIRAVSADGTQLWYSELPDEWKVLNSWDLPGTSPEGYGYSLGSYPVVTESEGSLYLFAFKRLSWQDIDSVRYENESNVNITYQNETCIYTRPANQYLTRPCKVVKIAPDGSIAWEYKFNTSIRKWNIGGLCDPSYVSFDHPVKIDEQSGRTYVFHDYAEDVLDQNGRLLFSIRNISDPAIVDSSGNIYAVRGELLRGNQSGHEFSADGRIPDGVNVDEYLTFMASDPDFQVPTSTVEAYDLDGRQLWSTDIGCPASRQMIVPGIWSRYYTLPMYTNDTLYVPVYSGVAAVDKAGHLQWVTRPLNGPFVLYEAMPFDSKGNVYLRRDNPTGSDASFMELNWLVVISPDGRISPDAWPFYRYDPVRGDAKAPLVLGGSDGILYTTGASRSDGLSMIPADDFEAIFSSKSYPADTITAYDVKNRTALWHFVIPKSDVHALIVAPDTPAEALWSIYGGRGEINGSYYLFGPMSTEAYPLKPISTNLIGVLPGENVVYLNYYYSVTETPLINNLSRCVYAKGLYALNDNGKLLWEQQTDGYITAAVVNNSTIYYRTSDGTMGKGTANVAAGIAIAAILYLVFRFLAVGTVSRARNRLDRNENRNQVLEYIAGNPGSTAYDMVRGLGMNLGTLRYHLLILSINHRIVTHSDGDKYVRYFKNSCSYTPKEQALLSLLSRAPVQRVLKVLMDKPGISGSELSRALGISDTAAYKHVNLLVENGIVIKGTIGERGAGYSIKDEYRPLIASTGEKP